MSAACSPQQFFSLSATLPCLSLPPFCSEPLLLPAHCPLVKLSALYAWSQAAQEPSSLAALHPAHPDRSLLNLASWETTDTQQRMVQVWTALLAWYLPKLSCYWACPCLGLEKSFCPGEENLPRQKFSPPRLNAECVSTPSSAELEYLCVRDFFRSKVKNPSVFACLEPESTNFGDVFIPVSNAFHAGLALYKQLFLCLISIFLLNYISLIFNFIQSSGFFCIQRCVMMLLCLFKRTELRVGSEFLCMIPNIFISSG